MHSINQINPTLLLGPFEFFLVIALAVVINVLVTLFPVFIIIVRDGLSSMSGSFLGRLFGRSLGFGNRLLGFGPLLGSSSGRLESSS
jgi:hypothetical protein